MAISYEFCSIDAIDELRAFIRDHWDSHHVLVRSTRCMDWQYRDDTSGCYNFLLAREGRQGIVGILGFIPTSRYDATLANDNETVWLTTWKVRENYAYGLGLQLLRSLTSRLQPQWIGTIGLNPATQGIYAALGYRLGSLSRHYLMNEDLAGRTLAEIPSSWSSPPATSGATALRPLAVEELFTATEKFGLDEGHQVPRKTRAYLHDRFLTHPFYDYRLFLACDGTTAAVIVVRACHHADAVALRIVDLLGDPVALAGCGPAFRGLLAEFGAEYIDFYCTGLETELAAAGFRVLQSTDRLVLPSHFEPFERRNIDLLYTLHGRGGPLVVCKGDADQDRPNLVDEMMP